MEGFSRARVLEPRAVAMTMPLVSDVVRSRHHIPAAMLERILIEADPVLTWGAGVLRVEGFSSCCGTYVRANIDGSVLEANERRVGTTNVDFNDGMRSALPRRAVCAWLRTPPARIFPISFRLNAILRDRMLVGLTADRAVSRSPPNTPLQRMARGGYAAAGERRGMAYAMGGHPS